MSERVLDLILSLIMDVQTDASSPAVFFLIHLNDHGKYSPSVRARLSLQLQSSLCLPLDLLSHHSSFGRLKSMFWRSLCQAEEVKQPSCCLRHKRPKTTKLHHRAPSPAFSCHVQHNWICLSLISERGFLNDCPPSQKLSHLSPGRHQWLQQRQRSSNKQWGKS